LPIYEPFSVAVIVCIERLDRALRPGSGVVASQPTTTPPLKLELERAVLP